MDHSHFFKRPPLATSRYYLSVVLLLSCAWASDCFTAQSHENRLSNQITHVINQSLKQWKGNANIGIIVQAMNTHHILYRKNANHVFTPASTLKLLTATAALTELGPEFQFTTRLRSQVGASLSSKGDWQGDIELVFSGDPSLEAQDLEALIRQLKTRYAIHRIRGNLYINKQLFDEVNYGPGWMWDELNACYAAPASSIIVGKNCFNIKLTPAKKIDHPASLDYQTQYPNLTPVISTVTTQKEASHCELTIHASDLNNYHISGCVEPHSKEDTLSIAIKNPTLYAKQLVQFFLNQHHLPLTGKIIIAAPPHPLKKILVVHYSAPLHQLIKTMLKESDNLIANTIYRRVGAHYFKRNNLSWENSAQAIAKILSKKTGINFSQLHLADGAGLSRYNLIRPQQMSQLLDYIYHTPDLYRYIFPALPIAGVDGTLESRLKKQTCSHKIHAKTGTMTSGSGLAGYIQTLSGQNIAFVIEINGFTENHKLYEALEDKICLGLAQLH